MDEKFYKRDIFSAEDQIEQLWKAIGQLRETLHTMQIGMDVLSDVLGRDKVMKRLKERFPAGAGKDEDNLQ